MLGRGRAGPIVRVGRDALAGLGKVFTPLDEQARRFAVKLGIRVADRAQSVPTQHRNIRER